MELKELIEQRGLLLEDSQDEHQFISDSSFLSTCLPYLSETKYTDTEDYNESYCVLDNLQIKINAYIINESGERLQLFIVNEDSLLPSLPEESIMISQKNYYEKYFSRCLNFFKKSVKGLLEDEMQDSSPEKALTVWLSSEEGLESIDVVEIFVLSATLTVETRGEQPGAKRMTFEDDSVKVSYTKGSEKIFKEITVIKRVIDVNFLFEVSVSQGNREPLRVDLSEYLIECLPATIESKYESYLCVLPAPLLVDLYKKHSSRMLEKNVRSFLQLKNSVNKGIQHTIQNEPEKFVAYNNGLTITATDKEFDESGDRRQIVSLTDFQIVNGGQTTATIYFSHKSGMDISKVKVMAKINIARDSTEEELEDLISSISEYSNAQSRVSPVDLRSRNTQLVKLKSLSETIVTPSGKKWFFERARGEFNTLIRKEPSKKIGLNRDFPKERRFTKEELAKYYMAWGDQPHIVKKGGEKVFRQFIESISREGKNGPSTTIDRDFFEQTIARIILFKKLEQIHGMGPNAIGQLRSAVVPYALSIIYKYSTGDRFNGNFNLAEIWKKEGLDDHLLKAAELLMVLVNKLIKKYSHSDDYGEYSKKAELWNSIQSCSEIKQFVSEDLFKKALKRYCIEDVKVSTIGGGKAGADKINFGPVYASIKQFTSDQQTQTSLTKALDFIIKKYEVIIKNDRNMVLEFANIRKKAAARGARDAVVFTRIGKLLNEGEPPALEHLEKATNYTDKLR